MVQQWVAFDHLKRNRGYGSRTVSEDWLDENSRIKDNKWTSSQTTFWPHDTDAKGETIPRHMQRRFQKLRQRHDRYAGESENYNRKTEIRYGHIMNDVYTFCNVCELPAYQTESVASIIKTANISSNAFGGRSYEKIILAVMSLVVDRDIDTTENLDTRLIVHDGFRDLMDAVGLGATELRRIRRSVQQRINIYDHTPI